MTHVLVCGSRIWTDLILLETQLHRLNHEHRFTLLIHGGAMGADLMADLWAQENHIPVKTMRPRWDLHGRSAGFIRNIEMLNERPDRVIAFIKGASHGTKHTVRHAQERNIPTHTFYA